MGNLGAVCRSADGRLRHTTACITLPSTALMLHHCLASLFWANLALYIKSPRIEQTPEPAKNLFTLLHSISPNRLSNTTWCMHPYLLLPYSLRLSAALGLGAVHCINTDTKRYRARKKRNSAGAEKWLDVRMWDSPSDCINTARAAGFHVVATHFDPEAVSIHDVDWTQPTAVVLGNERDGEASLFFLRGAVPERKGTLLSKVGCIFLLQ